MFIPGIRLSCHSDSGRIVFLEYILEVEGFVQLHYHTYGKSGVRRVVPGEYLAVDPCGRCAMIGAMESAKLCYVLSRDNKGQLTISSPLEKHAPATLTYSMVALDVGFENPMFATLEAKYPEDKSGLSETKKASLFVSTDFDVS